jgi:hypothetical protein
LLTTPRFKSQKIQQWPWNWQLKVNCHFVRWNLVTRFTRSVVLHLNKKKTYKKTHVNSRVAKTECYRCGVDHDALKCP